MKRGKTVANKLLSCGLVAMLVAASLTGCGKKNKGEESLIEQAAAGSKDYVFSEEALDIGFTDAEYPQRLKIVGNRIFAMTNDSDNGRMGIYSFNSDGSDVKKYYIPVGVNEGISYCDFDSDENLYAISYKYYWGDGEDVIYSSEDSDETDESAIDASATDDSVTDAVEADSKEEAAQESTADESAVTADTSESDGLDTDVAGEVDADDEEESDESYFLSKYDSTGNLIYKVKFDNSFIPEGNSYISINGIAYSDQYGVLVSVANQIYSYNETDGFKKLVKDDNKSTAYYYLYKGFQDKIFIGYYSDEGQKLCPFDPATGKIGESSAAITRYGDYTFFGGNGYDLYICDENAAYGYDMAKDEMTKLMDYADSDLMITSAIYAIVAVSDQEFVALLPDSEYNYYLSRLTKVPADQVVDKVTLTMAGYSIPYNVRRKALSYNKTSNKYKIKVVDYSSLDNEENYSAGSDRLNLDIVSGNTPDILVLSSEMPVNSYMNKGLFVDLNSMLENDPDISEADLLTNILDASKTNGKLYQLIPAFSVQTVVCKEKLVDGKNSLTFKDCNELIKQLNPNKEFIFGMTTREYFMSQGLKFSGDKYIDWDERKCYFNNDSFIEFLEMANKLPVEYSESAWEDFKDTIYRDNEAIFDIYNIQTYNDYRYLKDAIFGEEISFIGFPNDMGVNYSTIEPEIRLAMCTQCKDKDGAWEFLKSFLSEEFQDNLSYNIPIRKSSLDKFAAKSMERPYYMEKGKKVEYDSSIYINGVEVIIHPLNTEDVTKVTNFIKELSLISNSNNSVNDIINEEASAFFSGQKSAKEVADIIQSRLSIYVNENS